LNLIAKCAKSPIAKVESLVQTLDGREMDTISAGTGERIVWITHRQHPGESMAEYYSEGLLTRLLGLDKQGEIDGAVHKLLKEYAFYIIPCMCPGGAARGYLRTNARGANLNRAWATLEDGS
jgi:murein tripeptide amidase MpaA